jgi:hypothetical protein
MAGMGASGFLTRLLRTVQDMIDAGITARLGTIIQGGRVKWPYLEQGHGYELVLSGAVDITITAGSDQAYVDVTFDANRPYSAVPILCEAVQNDPGGGHFEGDYQAWHTRLTAAGFRLHIAHFPLSATNFPVVGGTTVHTGAMDSPPVATSTPSVNQTSDNANDTTGMHGVGTGSPVSPIETQLAYSKVAGANGSGGDGTSGASGTGASGAGSTGHVHQENTAATYTQNANTAGAGAAHTHTGPSHTHGVPDAQHKHTYDDHVHSLNNHHHDLSNHTHNNGAHTHALTLDTLTVDVTPTEGSNRTLHVGWIAVGLQTPPS